MPQLDDILHTPQGRKLLGDEKKLEQLRSAPDTQKLFDLLGRSAGGDLEQAVQKGDSAALVAAIRKVMGDPEGAKLIQSMKDKLG